MKLLWELFAKFVKDRPEEKWTADSYLSFVSFEVTQRNPLATQPLSKRPKSVKGDQERDK